MDGRHAWIDASAGVAGDMLLGALLDAGASLDAVRAAIDAVVPGAVALSVEEVRRAGMRATKVHVTPTVDDPPHRTWRDVRELIGRAHARTGMEAVFDRLARAEARVHGTDPEDVHFHEVGALDSIADVVGVCAAIDDLGITSISAGEVALGSGSVRATHGRLPVPAPAVAELAKGWRVRGDGPGELATPTGMALIRALAERCETLPPMTVERVGVGAGTRDTPDRPNVVRVVISEATAAPRRQEDAVLIEANVDDLDPRLWPGVLADLLKAGADDAWLVPILMKKGRPAHTLCVLAKPGLTARLRDQIFRDTTTLGVREGPLRKTVVARTFSTMTVAAGTTSIKVGHVDGVIVQVMPEFEDVAARARATGRPERVILQEAMAAAVNAGLTVGAPLPPALGGLSAP
ncbi:MAG TPA: nickel pincer cofactor biosynthesis protein LarC [Actinoplanes sp.]